MASDMIEFFSGLLQSLAVFLGEPPIVYFVGILALVAVCKAFRAFLQ